MATERINRKRVLHLHGQPIKASAHIRYSGHQPDAGAGGQRHHVRSAASTVLSVEGSTSLGSVITSSPQWIDTRCPVTTGVAWLVGEALNATGISDAL